MKTIVRGVGKYHVMFLDEGRNTRITPVATLHLEGNDDRYIIDGNWVTKATFVAVVKWLSKKRREN